VTIAQNRNACTMSRWFWSSRRREIRVQKAGAGPRGIAPYGCLHRYLQVPSGRTAEGAWSPAPQAWMGGRSPGARTLH
jgi:hypothetical protein